MPPRLTYAEFCAQLIPGKVFYFSCDALHTSDPHYFVLVMNQTPDIYYFSCVTSQLATMQRLVELKRYPHESIVFFSGADPENPFTKDCFVNCNEVFPYGVEELWYLYDEGELTIKGDIPPDSYHQVVIGFHSSPLIELELKELLPNPNAM
jgi:hypothetical protein